MKIDTRGRACPEPLIITKRALSGASEGETIEVLSDNDTSCGNLMSYISSLGFKPVRSYADGVSTITFTIGQGVAAAASKAPAAQDCVCEAPAGKGRYAVVLRSDLMGSGDDELGALLMRSCVNSLADMDVLPAVVVLYNAGVKLAVECTDTAASLAALRNAGVEVMVCGTCVDFFGIREKLAVGTVSNMLSINNALAAAGHIIYP